MVTTENLIEHFLGIIIKKQAHDMREPVDIFNYMLNVLKHITILLYAQGKEFLFLRIKSANSEEAKNQKKNDKRMMRKLFHFCIINVFFCEIDEPVLSLIGFEHCRIKK